MSKHPNPGLVAKFHRFYWRQQIKRILRINRRIGRLTETRSLIATASANHHKKGWMTNGKGKRN